MIPLPLVARQGETYGGYGPNRLEYFSCARRFGNGRIYALKLY